MENSLTIRPAPLPGAHNHLWPRLLLSPESQPAPAHSQALAALCAGLPAADADPLAKGQGVARVWLWECPSPVPVLEKKWETEVAPQETAASTLVWAKQANL